MKQSIAHKVCRYDSADGAVCFSGYIAQQCVLHFTRSNTTSRSASKAVAVHSRSRLAISTNAANNWRLSKQYQLQKWYSVQLFRALPFRQQIAISMMFLKPFSSTSSIDLAHVSYVRRARDRFIVQKCRHCSRFSMSDEYLSRLVRLYFNAVQIILTAYFVLLLLSMLILNIISYRRLQSALLFGTRYTF